MPTAWFAVVSLILAGWNEWGQMGGWGWGMAIFGWLLMAGIVGLVAWLITTAVRDSTSSAHRNSTGRDILDARYARGKIDRDGYLQRKGDLES